MLSIVKSRLHKALRKLRERWAHAVEIASFEQSFQLLQMTDPEYSYHYRASFAVPFHSYASVFDSAIGWYIELLQRKKCIVCTKPQLLCRADAERMIVGTAQRLVQEDWMTPAEYDQIIAFLKPSLHFVSDSSLEGFSLATHSSLKIVKIEK